MPQRYKKFEHNLVGLVHKVKKAVKVLLDILVQEVRKEVEE